MINIPIPISYILTLFLIAWCTPTPAQILKVGDEAPDFSLQDLSGDTYTLSAFREKKSSSSISWDITEQIARRGPPK